MLSPIYECQSNKGNSKSLMLISRWTLSFLIDQLTCEGTDATVRGGAFPNDISVMAEARVVTFMHRSCSFPFYSCSLLDPKVGHTMEVLFTTFSFLSVILIDSSTGSPVNVLMLSVQAVRCLPRLCAPSSY